MNLVFLYGPPAVGKLTVGRELAELTGYRLFHNHLVVDAVAAVFDFGSKSFVRLREEIWLSVFGTAAREGTDMIFTFTPERTVRESFVANATNVVASEGGRVRPVELTCPLSEIERRVESESRRQFGKLRSLDLLRSLELGGELQYLGELTPECSVDTGAVQPRDAALRIRAALGLPAP